MKFYKDLYLGKHFFYIAIILVVLFVVGNFFPFAFSVAKAMLILYLLLIIIDVLLLWRSDSRIITIRKTPNRLSLADKNYIYLECINHYPITIYYSLVEELPAQFQKRDFLLSGKIAANNTENLSYSLLPKTRGEYNFGSSLMFIETRLGMVSRRFKTNNECMCPVYPSYIQMRKYELLAISNRLDEIGIKKTRKLGHQLEFEHIRDYTIGDDPRTVNWKASARKSTLMVNQYQDECSQAIYSLINMGRTMQMPFKGMTLLDYTINSSLVLSNIALQKSDKAGLLTYSNSINSFLGANKNAGQMQKIMELLYHQKTNFEESDTELLYATIHSKIHVRSLLILYTNYEGMPSLKNQLPVLRQLAKKHLLLVVLFKNTEVDSIANGEAKNTSEIYIQTIARKYNFEKEMMIKEMSKYGIYGILTTPDGLSVNLINKYLEFKSKRLI